MSQQGALAGGNRFNQEHPWLPVRRAGLFKWFRWQFLERRSEEWWNPSLLTQ